jgi:hypothetical protein
MDPIHVMDARDLYFWKFQHTGFTRCKAKASQEALKDLKALLETFGFVKSRFLSWPKRIMYG